MKAEVGGLEFEVEVPEGFVVTAAITTVHYQGLKDEQLYQGTSWGSTAMSYPQAVGMHRLTQIDMEKGAKQA